jgi:hypothetical protein
MSVPSSRAIGTRSLLRIIGLLSLALALASCSAIKLGYNTLPELAFWWVDGYVDLDDAQRQPVRDDLARIHAWHRAEELPRYRELLVQMERLAATEFTPAQACALEPQLRERVAALLARVEPAITAQALTLKPAQLRYLERKYAKRNREYVGEWVELSPDELAAKRLKEIAERSETVYGTLNDAQRAILGAHLRTTAWTPALVLAERQRRQQDTLAVLRRLASQDIGIEPARSAVHGLLARFVVSPDPAYRAWTDRLRTEVCGLASALQASATPDQRDYAVRRMRAWQRDLSELAAAR